MKKAFLVGLGLAVALVGLAVALPFLRARFLAAGAQAVAEPSPPAPMPSPELSPAPSAPPVSVTPAPEEAQARIKPLGKPRLDAQIREVVGSMDRAGRPPAGVVQGGRRGGRRGVFENLERRLPVHPSGYYRESDVWPPRAGGRGAERLIFGREGEVYYSPDHYRTFVRLR